MDKYLEPDWERSALITIDTQVDTLDGQPFEVPGTSDILPSMKLLLDVFRQRQLPVVHIVRIYKRDGSNVELCRRADVESGGGAFLEGGSGSQLADALFDDPITLDSALLLSGKIQPVTDKEVIIYKPRWGAFYETPLETHLKSLGVNTLIFSGCNFPNCPRTSIYEASERDYKIVLVEDAISGLYSKGRQELINIGVELMNIKQVSSLLVSNHRMDD